MTAPPAPKPTTPQLLGISITPSVSLGIGEKYQFRALGSYSDGTSEDMTRLVAWDTQDPHVLSFTSGGLATAGATGTTAIKASYEAVTGRSDVTVGPQRLIRGWPLLIKGQGSLSYTFSSTLVPGVYAKGMAFNGAIPTDEAAIGINLIQYQATGGTEVSAQSFDIVRTQLGVDLVGQHLHVTWPHVGDSSLVMILDGTGQPLFNAWVYQDFLDFDCPKPDLYTVMQSTPSEPWDQTRIDTRPYAQTRKPVLYYPLTDTVSPTIAFSCDTDPRDVSYSFQIQDADDPTSDPLVLTGPSPQLEATLPMGRYRWRAIASTLAQQRETLSQPSEWQVFTVRPPSGSLEDVLGTPPLAQAPSFGAPLAYPTGTEPLPDGSYLIADTYHNVLKRADGNTVTTVLGSGVAGYNGDRVGRQAALNHPTLLASEHNGTTLFVDAGNDLIRRFDAGTGAVTTAYGLPGRLAANRDATRREGLLGLVTFMTTIDHEVYIGMSYPATGTNQGTIWKLSGGTLQELTELDSVLTGEVFGADRRNGIWFVVEGANDAATLVAIGSSGIKTLFQGLVFPSNCIALDAEHVLVGGGSNIVYYNAGTIQEHGNYSHVANLFLAPNGKVVVTDSDAGAIYTFDPVTESRETLVENRTPFASPIDLSVLPNGDLAILTNYPGGIYELNTRTGATVKVAGNGKLGRSEPGRDALDSPMYFPASVTSDSLGNVYYSEEGAVFKINRVSHSIALYAGDSRKQGYFGDSQYRLAAGFVGPRGLACDIAGNLFIADSYGNRVRRVDSGSGIVSTVAGTGSDSPIAYGGGAAESAINHPIGIAVLGESLYIAQSWRNVISRVNRSGVLERFAGVDAQTNYQGDGRFCPGGVDVACFNAPAGLAADAASGGLIIADQFNDRIRLVVGGDVSTLAGDGRSGYGENTLNLPFRAVPTETGLFIMDTANGLLRLLPSASQRPKSVRVQLAAGGSSPTAQP